MNVNDVFLSFQGEGARVGTVNVFVRFSGCDQRCRLETHGFDCDTEFSSRREYGQHELLARVQEVGGSCRSVIFTGGEPAIQVTESVVALFRSAGYYTAIETNGNIHVPDALDWIAVSPKCAEHTIRQLTADEVRYVRSPQHGIPQPHVMAREGRPLHKFLSPAFRGDTLDRDALENCIRLCRDNPTWRLSVQQHKFWGIA